MQKLLDRIANRLAILLTRFNGARCGRFCTVSIRSTIKVIGGGSIQLGDRCQIHAGAMILSYGGAIEIGNDVSINPYCIVYGHGGLKIGNGVRIAAQTVLIPSNHNFDDKHTPIFEQGETSKGITIGDDVWLGAGVRVLDGVNIARGCVIAAGSVVTKSTDEYGVYAGVPAKKIKSRS